MSEFLAEPGGGDSWNSLISAVEPKPGRISEIRLEL
jgi:hypothetical protein